MPYVRGGRPLKRWRYVGVFGERTMVCVGLARVLGVPQAWWAVWHREEGWLRERTLFARPARAVRFAAGRASVRDGDCEIDLVVDEAPGIESVCPHGAGYVWTRKQAAIPVRGLCRRAKAGRAPGAGPRRAGGGGVRARRAGRRRRPRGLPRPPHLLALVGRRRRDRRRARGRVEPRRRGQRPGGGQRALAL